MKRLLTAFSAALIALAALAAAPALATPGAVDKKGCHNKKRNHCHAAAEINTSPRGFRYVPFGYKA